MSRAIPLDELLLQLAESLHKSLRLRVAEVCTGTDGILDRASSVPDRGPARIVLDAEAIQVVARSHVSGPAWSQVWIPDLLVGRTSTLVRVVAVSHLGDLLGLLVVERAPDQRAFTDEDDRVLAELTIFCYYVVPRLTLLLTYKTQTTVVNKSLNTTFHCRHPATSHH